MLPLNLCDPRMFAQDLQAYVYSSSLATLFSFFFFFLSPLIRTQSKPPPPTNTFPPQSDSTAKSKGMLLCISVFHLYGKHLHGNNQILRKRQTRSWLSRNINPTPNMEGGGGVGGAIFFSSHGGGESKHSSELQNCMKKRDSNKEVFMR